MSGIYLKTKRRRLLREKSTCNIDTKYVKWVQFSGFTLIKTLTTTFIFFRHTLPQNKHLTTIKKKKTNYKVGQMSRLNNFEIESYFST